MNLNKRVKLSVGIKRWLLLGILGLVMFSYGVSPIYVEINLFYNHIFKYLFFSILGVLLLYFSVKKSFKSFLQYYNVENIDDKHDFKISDLFNSSMTKLEDKNIKLFSKRKALDKGPKIVVIGGGTGLSVLLRGLKKYTTNITAIVTVADDGGGSGVLREDLGMLPPGDIRNCILALADTEPIMEKLLQYRFEDGKLKGQSFGNLFIAAMNGICGNFEIAIKEMSNVLAVTGKVLPMTLEDVKLYAKLKNGKVIEGESNIPIENRKIGSEIDYVYIKPKESYPLKEAIEAIKEADCIVLGPGSLYTSVIPNLLVNGLSDAIYNSTAIKVYVANVMTQPGETDGYNVLDHVNAIFKHSKDGLINYVIANKEEIPNKTLLKYYKDGAKPVVIDEEQEQKLKAKGISVIKDNLVDIKKNYIRHDALRVSKILIDLILERNL
ncbi:gluconeogenesis factor YvcK family protein [Caloranaerobacter ferrireducens]|uniref:gluconeogenesis factor YvcK family protein n=1 Tax=Caloranaerobacter ferrireducens TaxID=1323370 RepID=UPI00084CFF6A|nr:YvcK family protein [Caloranaerobacter ferrireducens]